MACIRFLAPTITRPLNRNDRIVIQNFSGQNAGSPTNCFSGQRPIFLANLFRNGSRKAAVIEFIPLNRKTLPSGLKLTNFVSLGSCTLGPEAVPRFRGKIVSCSCGTQ
ncbi:hypothetical protein [Paenibacillus montanisoli]|uniref:hypothetical protein n=1 Tax=Paenibacillus montanisoli TaxID=2081970 RepID=UPI0010582419|nr:hypothetical protein [Paenibacillus montanisoli]